MIYDTLGIKCSQARVNNSRIKMPLIFAFIKKILLENTYQVFFYKCGCQGNFSF